MEGKHMIIGNESRLDVCRRWIQKMEWVFEVMKFVLIVNNEK